ncbi:B3 domain-containing protein At1g49475-like [Lolium perenne]|uniref:B3 domain-containing protein At1g49475-like n=1 Tax=Lolium perenne TaxID=4522 RepID=UPI003A997C30
MAKKQEWEAERKALEAKKIKLEYDIYNLLQTEKIMIGSPAEVSDEGPAKKRRGRPANVGHFHEYVWPDHFFRIIFKPTFGRLMIPQAFVKWFGEIPSNIIVTTNTGCNWRMTTRREGNDPFIDQGWVAFAIAHQLKVGQFLTFKKVSSFEYSVVIFDHTCTEVVSR